MVVDLAVVIPAKDRDRDVAAYVLDRVPVVLRLLHVILDDHGVGLDQLGLRILLLALLGEEYRTGRCSSQSGIRGRRVRDQVELV